MATLNKQEFLHCAIKTNHEESLPLHFNKRREFSVVFVLLMYSLMTSVLSGGHLVLGSGFGSGFSKDEPHFSVNLLLMTTKKKNSPLFPTQTTTTSSGPELDENGKMDCIKEMTELESCCNYCQRKGVVKRPRGYKKFYSGVY